MTNPYGGFRRRASYIAQQRALSPEALVLDTGDALTGKARPGIETKGQIIVAGMNLMGYDAMALGPEELDLGREVVAQRAAEAAFPFLSANAVDTATGQLAAEPYVVLDRGGLAIGVLGVTRPPVRALTDFEVTDPLAALARYVPELGEQADYIVVLTSIEFPTAVSMASVVPGIAVMVAAQPGDYPAAVVAPSTGTIVVVAEEPNKAPVYTGRRVGRLAIPVLAGGVLGVHEWESLQMGPPIPEDPSMSALLAAGGY